MSHIQAHRRLLYRSLKDRQNPMPMAYHPARETALMPSGMCRQLPTLYRFAIVRIENTEE